MAHATSENRHGLVVATAVSSCSPKQERLAAIAMMGRLKQSAKPRTVVADEGYHEQDFVEQLQQMGRGRACSSVPAWRPPLLGRSHAL
jgi:hypothetical protein